jgi:hypothetical protein
VYVPRLRSRHSAGLPQQPEISAIMYSILQEISEPIHGFSNFLKQTPPVDTGVASFSFNELVTCVLFVMFFGVGTNFQAVYPHPIWSSSQLNYTICGASIFIYR